MSSPDVLARLELVLAASSDGLWDMTVEAGDPVNPKNEFWWSDRFRQMLGFTDENDFPNVLESWSSRLHPEDSEQVINAFKSHLLDCTGETPYDIEYRLQVKSGEYKWFRATGATLRDEKGIPLRVAGSLRDITDERKTNIAVQNLVARFELVNKASSNGLWDMTVEAGDPVNPKNEFWWSDRFREMLGFYSERDFPNVLDSWSSRLHPDDAGRVIDAFKSHLLDLSGRTPYDIEYRLKLRSGEYRWFRVTGATLRTEDGTPLRVAGALIDIDSARLSEAAIREGVSALQSSSEKLTEISAVARTDAEQTADQAAEANEQTKQFSKSVRGIVEAAHVLLGGVQEVARFCCRCNKGRRCGC